MTILYLITAICWGLYAAKYNTKVYGPQAQPLIAFLLNAALCPLAIIFALIYSR